MEVDFIGILTGLILIVKNLDRCRILSSYLSKFVKFSLLILYHKCLKLNISEKVDSIILIYNEIRKNKERCVARTKPRLWTKFCESP